MTAGCIVTDLNRREMLARLAAAAAVLAVGCDDDNAARGLCAEIGGGAEGKAGEGLGSPVLAADPFTLGVASGDPLPDGVVIWTRLAPDPLAEDGAGGMPDVAVGVAWEVAEDAGFARVVQRGTAAARPERGHAVHVDVRCLEPATTYHYRFGYGDVMSSAGRTRTAPAVDAAPDAMTLAVGSCQDFRDGYYTAQGHLAREDVDLVLFVGDYIYEQPGEAAVREHVGDEPRDLAGYRRRYAQYKMDVNLQAAHAAHAWVATWDDHEVDGNYAGVVGQEPVSSAEFLARRDAAYQAWQEHLPVRLGSVEGGSDGREVRIYRRFDYGDLCRICVLDTRQYRDRQPCPTDGFSTMCEDWVGYEGTLLGAAQEAWLAESLRSSAARWNVVAQQVVMTSTLLLGGRVGNNDQWDGYPVAQQRVRDLFAEPGVENVVVLTGDLHGAGVGRLTARIEDGESEQVGVEFLGTSFTSRNSTQEDPAAAEFLSGFVRELPQIAYFDLTRRGYLVCRVERDRWEARFRVVSTVAEETADVSDAVVFEVAHGSGQITRLDEVPSE